VQVYCPGTPGAGSGWLELDPTNNLVPDTRHVRLALGRDYGDVTPLRGVIRGGGRHSLHVSVNTRCLDASQARMLLS
jgi:transglutaminase-like putative cysteine protease